MTNKTITAARRTRLEQLVTTNNQGGDTEGRTLKVVQAWAQIGTQPKLTDNLQALWSIKGNAAYYLPPDITGVGLNCQLS